jgi:sigma-B regulation protein RsbU (phosphoserine phosphatase)
MLSRDSRPAVLIADDQTDVLESLRLLLGPEGFRTEVVTTPDQVVDRLARGQVDLLLMDLNYTRDTTSGQEGLSLIERIRAVEPLLPIVAMTGWSTVELAVEAMRKGIRHFVQKPWDNDALVSLLRAEVDEGRANRLNDRRRRREIEDAGEVQRSLLPHALPVVPGLELAVHWQPASAVGGDAFDVSLIAADKLAISVADVSGKGVPAALLASSISASVRAIAPAVGPAGVCARVNATITGQIPDGRFVTFVLGVVDPATRRLSYTNAGHNPPILVRGDGEVVRLETGGPVLGVIPDAPYELGQLDLRAGDRLVFFTDGIVEATDGRDEFGDERLVSLVAAERRSSPRDIVRHIVDAVASFNGSAREDDMTLVVVAVD